MARLPLTLQTGVKSLGRESPGAPIAVANAEARATLMWGQAIQGVTGLVGNILTAQDTAAGELALAERVQQDKKSTAQLDAYLATTPVINLDDPDTPDVVKRFATKYAKQQGNKTGRVVTADIMTGVAEAHFQESRSASLDILKEHGQSKALQASYINKMEPTWTRSGTSSITNSIAQTRERQKQQTLDLVSEAINAGQEIQAEQYVREAVNAGVLTPEEAGPLIRGMGPQADWVTFNRMVSEARTQSDLDAAEDYLASSRVAPDKRIQGFGKLDQQLDRQFMLMQRGQTLAYAQGQDMLTNGVLTSDWISQQARSGRLSGAQQQALRNGLAKPPALASSPQIVSDLEARIGLLQMPGVRGMPPPKAQRRMIMESLQREYLGINADGSTKPKTITGEDFTRLTQDANAAFEKATGKGNQALQDAQRMVKSSTGYSDVIEARMEGPYPAGLAYADLMAALRDHMETAGPNADPIDFVTKNRQYYTADLYAKSHQQRLAQKYPQYADMLMQENVPVGAILDRAIQDGLPYPDFEHLRRGLQYKLVEIKSDASRTQGYSGEMMQ